MFEVRKGDFIKALKTVLPACKSERLEGNEPPNSILFFDKEWIRGNNGLSISYKFETGIEGALPVKELVKLLPLMEKGYPVGISQENGLAIFECGPTIVRLAKLKETLEPVDLNNAKWSPVPKRLLDGLRLSLLSTDKSERRLKGIVIKENKIVSTDNYRASVYEMGGEVGPDALRLDVESVKALLRLKTKFDSITLADGRLYFKSGGSLVVGLKLMPVKDYPLKDVLSVFDRVGTGDLETYRFPNNLEELIGNVEPVAGKGAWELNFSTQITLRLEDGNLIASSENRHGELEDSIPWDGKFPEGGITVSPLFLKRILKVTRFFKVTPAENMLLFEIPYFKFFMLAKVLQPEGVLKNRLAREVTKPKKFIRF